MTWDLWPQWLLLFWLIAPTCSFPMFRLAKGESFNDIDFIAAWMHRVIGNAVLAGVLYAGGFWA